MLYSPTLISIIEVLIVTVPILMVVAYVTVAERKTMASMQRRLGPNVVGYYGLLQAFADALKLLLKEYVSPTQANLSLFFLGPIITLIFALLGYAVIPFGPGLALYDYNLGILYMLAVSSLATYGILLAGWSANSKYAFLGSLRSTAQLISYELILSSAILIVIMLTGSLSLTVNIEAQRAVWFILPLAPIFIIFFIGAVAETNRAPFDLAEAESELVSGFMTEHAAVIFVFFFLAEYASIVLICILTSILFLGGYLYDILPLQDALISLTQYIDFGYYMAYLHSPYYLDYLDHLVSNPNTEGLYYGLSLGVKACAMIFTFIWVRASFPRIRFDQLMLFCWTILLPIVIAFVVLVPCILYSFDIIPSNVSLLFAPTLIFFATEEELLKRSEELHWQLEQADRKNAANFEKENELAQDPQADPKEVSDNENAIYDAAIERCEIEDNIWANNLRLNNLNNGGEDNRPADDFDPTIDKTQDNEWNESNPVDLSDENEND